MNILLISTLYPEPQEYGIVSDTKAVHFFAREWVKMGHRVVVFHPYRNPLPKLFSIRCGIKYSRIDGVDILFGQNQLFVPHNFVPYAFQQKHLARLFLKYLEEKYPKFVPDFISVHFPLCSLDFAERVSSAYAYNNCRVAYVFHGSDMRLLKKMDRKCKDRVISRLREKSSLQLYRSFQLENIAYSLGMPKRKEPVVISGIDNSLIASEDAINEKVHDIRRKSIKIVFAGKLNRQKRVDRIINALSSLQDGTTFSLSIIGDGDQRETLENLAKDKGIEDQVMFMGFQARETVSAVMFYSDVFIMVSENETLGLVYLEAMAQGCIPVGSRGEGIDGVIVDGRNGFLVDPKKEDELVATLLKITRMSFDERAKLVKNAYDTARGMTARNMAENYLNRLKDEE